MTLTAAYPTQVHAIESPSIKAAIEAARTVEEIRGQLADAIAERDRCIVVVAAETGWSVPRVGRLLGMSASNVRVILDRARWIAQGRDTAD